MIYYANTSETVHLTVYLEDQTGTAVTGATVTCRIRQADSDQFWDEGATAYSSTPDDIALTEVDSSDAPGEYRFSWDLSQAGIVSEPHIVKFTSSTTGVANIPQFTVVQVGTIGDAIERIRKVTTNSAISNSSDTLVTVYEDDGTTVAFTFTISADQRTRTTSL